MPESPGQANPKHFPRLFEPLTIGKLELANRIVQLPAGPAKTFEGTIGPGDVAFFEARARGGVGLIIMGATAAHPSTQNRARSLWEAYRPDHIPDFARLAQAVHRHETKLIGQLVHLGRESIGYADSPLLAPSSIRSQFTPRTAHKLTEAEIEDIISGFAISAGNLQAAGFDGVELHGAHAYLIAQFMSPFANQRADQWGGSFENRMRFADQVVARIRARCGEEFIVGARISADEQLEEGMELEHSSEIAKHLANNCGINYLSVAVGTRGFYVKDMSTPSGVALPLARELKRLIDIPVIASQRITHPSQAEAALERGDADLIGMARALLADPNWASWARRGASERIVPCVGLLQDCRLLNVDGGLSCAHNPITGREQEFGTLSPVARQRRVLVVGGGPAGLEVARISAERGHEVMLLEREPRLGGLIRLAAAAPHREEIEGVVSFREGELARLGVDVRVGVNASAEFVLGLNPDAIVVATGSRLGRAEFDIAEGSRVTTVPQVLSEEPASLEDVRQAVIIDDGNGAWETYSTAEYLARLGIAVTVVLGGGTVARGIHFESIVPLLARLRGAGVQFQILSKVVGISREGVTVFDPYRFAARKGYAEVVVPSDLTVLVGPTEPNNQLAVDLAARHPDVSAIGDCVSPRRLTEAVLDAQRVARAL